MSDEAAIPEEVMQAAKEIANEAVTSLTRAFFFVRTAEDAKQMHGICTAVAARAIIAATDAERERCAQIAEDATRAICRGDSGLDFAVVGPAGLGRFIASAIRSHPKKLPAGDAQ